MSATVDRAEVGLKAAAASLDEPASTGRLLEELEARTRAEADALLAAAREEGDAIRARAAAQCAAMRAEAIARCDGDSAAGNAMALSHARQEGRRLLLEAQRKAVDRVVSEATVVARQLVDDRPLLADVAIARATDLLTFLPDGMVEVRCAPAAVAALTAAVADRPLTHVLADPAIAAGVRASADQGRIVVDDTFEAWLTREADALAIEVSRALGGVDA